MKKIITLLIATILLYSVNAQIREENYNDYIVPPSLARTRIASVTNSTFFSEYGDCFTPRGPLKVLIVFCKFKGNDADKNNKYWPANQAYPNWIKDNSFVFKSLSDFNKIDPNNQSLSRYYYESTNILPEEQRFKLYAGYLSVTIAPQKKDTSWSQMIGLACEELSKIKNIDNILSQYDNRENRPNYKFDNSLNPKSDKIVDYVIFDFRFNKRWDKVNIPVEELRNANGSGGGFANNEITSAKVGSYTIKQGFCACDGISPWVKLYTHEIGHELYGGPHYGGSNDVLGDYLQSTKLWGMMSTISNEIFAGPNAWERWYLGWIKIKHDIKSKTENGTYILRDYYTTGDAIRIKMPYVDNQYIWLENHQAKSILEKRWDYGDDFSCSTLPKPPAGLMVYIESASDDKNSNNLNNLAYNKPNCMRLINKDGNYDLALNGYETRGEWCGNVVGKFHKVKTNPYSGYDVSSAFLSDKNNDNNIEYTNNYNKGPHEQDNILRIDGKFVYGNFATNAGFQVGDKVSISSNPAITNLQRYNTTTQKSNPIFLNGISIKVLSKNNNGDLTVQIKYDDFVFENSIRMCGNIILPPEIITVKENVNIDIDKSGTPNRTTKRKGEFVNPTIVSTSANTKLYLKQGATIEIENESALVIENGSTLSLEKGAKIIVKNGCSLHIKSSASLTLKGDSKIEVENGGYLCVEKGANLTLTDAFSVINIRNGAKQGVNSEVLPSVAAYQTPLKSIIYTGKGLINTFNDVLYIQNQIISKDTYFAGKEIHAGNAVTNNKAQGDVIIKSGNTVIFDSENGVTIDKGVNVEIGAVIETINH